MATSTPSKTPSPAPRLLAISALKGSRVGNFAGEDLGKVDDLVIDIASGRLGYVIVAQGGFLGIGDKLFAVPWELFTVRAADHEFLLDVEREMLLDAPSFERSHWPDMSDDAWASAIHSHFAQKPYWNSDITAAGDYTGDDRLGKSDRDRL
jgi:sporulation protein YlmC with PRC-barrel domain